jgi:hypothetical protein
MNSKYKEELVNSIGLFMIYQLDVTHSLNETSSELTPYVFIGVKQYLVYSQNHNRTLTKINLNLKCLKCDLKSIFKRNLDEKKNNIQKTAKICAYFNYSSQKLLLVHYLLISFSNSFSNKAKPLYAYIPWFLQKPNFSMYVT